ALRSGGGAHGHDFFAGDRYVGDEYGVGGDDLPAANDDIGFHQMTHPPSTAMSWPVICREASLAKHSTAFATSSSVETRFKAYSSACLRIASSTEMPRRFAISS